MDAEVFAPMLSPRTLGLLVLLVSGAGATGLARIRWPRSVPIGALEWALDWAGEPP